MTLNLNHIWRDRKIRHAVGIAIARGTLASLTLLGVGSLVLTSCWSGESTSTPDNAVVVEPDTAPDPSPATPTPEPNISPGPVPEETTSAPETTAPAPDNILAVQGATLPQSLVQEWLPLSDVLLAFGSMTITPDQIQWGSGQSSPYTIVGTDGGYLLRLESNPSFYDIPNPYIKLMPETDESGATTSMAVAFYESQEQAQNDEYIMYGSYFVE